MNDSKTTRREFIAAAAAAATGLAATGPASASHTPTVKVGIYREAESLWSIDVGDGPVKEAARALEEVDAQLPNVDVEPHRHPETARITPDYDDAESTIRNFEDALHESTDHLRRYDVHVFLYRKTVPVDASRDKVDMGGAGFTSWSWGKPDADAHSIYMPEGAKRQYDEGRYALGFVNAQTGSAGANLAVGAEDPQRLFRNTVIHEFGHAFDLRDSEDRQYDPGNGGPTVDYTNPGAITGDNEATPMATWYGDDLRGSESSSEYTFCYSSDGEVTKHTKELSVCSRTEIENWVAEYGVPYVEGVESRDVESLRPLDVDGDGLYEDITANGEASHADVSEFFERQHRSRMKHPEYFDFSGNGEVGHGDVKALFEEVATSDV